MNMCAREHERCLCATAQRIRARDCSWKWKLAKERAAHISFSATYCTIEYVFYICEKSGEKYHFVISNISAECTILEDWAAGTDPSFLLSNEHRLKSVIGDQPITVSGTRADIRVAIAINTFIPFDRKWIHIFRPFGSSNSRSALFSNCRELCTSSELVFSFDSSLW